MCFCTKEKKPRSIKGRPANKFNGHFVITCFGLLTFVMARGVIQLVTDGYSLSLRNFSYHHFISEQLSNQNKTYVQLYNTQQNVNCIGVFNSVFLLGPLFFCGKVYNIFNVVPFSL